MRLTRITRVALGFVNAPFSALRRFNVCMWHSGRCGSSVLGDLLRQDGRIVWGKEILERYSKKVEARNLQGAAWQGAKRRIRYNQLIAGARIFGFEMKIWHLKRMGVEPKTAWGFLKQQKYDKQIILERKNYLRVIVSGFVGQATSKLHCKTGESPVSAKIRLHLRSLRNGLRIFTKFYDEMKRLLPESSLLITYEDDILPDPVVAYGKVVNYLGLTPRHVVVNYQRTNQGNLQEIVVNLDEVREYLKGTQYEWMVTGD